MPAINKLSRTIFLTFLTFQLLLNVALTSAAVIRRNKREISVNVTDTTTTNNEVDSTTITTGKDVGILLYTTGSSEEEPITGKSFKDIPTTDGSDEDKKELTTSIGSTIDDNTVSFSKDNQKSYIDSRDGEYTIQENKRQEFTTSIGSNVDDSTISLVTDDPVVSRDGEDKIQEKTGQEFTTSVGSTVDDSTVGFVLDHKISSIDSREGEGKTQEKTTVESSDKSGDLETSTINEFKVQNTGQVDEVKRTESRIKESPSTTDVDAFESTETLDDSKSPETQFTVERESSAEHQSPFHSILDEEDPNKSELSTINFPDFKIETLTAQPIMLIETTTAKTQLLQLLNEEANSQKIMDSTTADADIRLNEKTDFKPMDETTSFSVIEVDEATKIPMKPNSSTREDILTELGTKPNETADSTDNTLDILSTSGSNQAPDFTTNTILSTPFTELRTFPNDVNALTSTFKSDDTTMIFTSTETSDEQPDQTTSFPNPPVQREIRILPNTSSAEKRGKFIDDNFSTQNEFNLPSTRDGWSVVGKIKSPELQNSVETSDERAINNSLVTKTLLDWTRVMMSTDAMDSESTVRNSEFIPSTTTEVPDTLTTTDIKLLRDNDVELLTTQAQPDVTTEMTDRAEIRESTVPRENEFETKIPTKFEETTNLDEKQEVSTPEQLINESTLPQTDGVSNDPVLSSTTSTFKVLRDGDNVFLENNRVDDDSAEEKPPLETTSTTTTTSTTPVPIIATIESETTNFPDTGETAPEENTGTLLTSTSTSTLSGLSLDFTTSVPFLTSTTMTTTTTAEAATTTPVTPMTTPLIAFNMDDRTNEPLNMETTTLIPLQSFPITNTIATTPTTTVMEPATTTTTATPPPPTITTTPAQPTTMPAVSVAATTETETEIQTTETEAHTPALAIISNNDMMTQKSNNYDYNNNNDEPLNKTTTNSLENSSIGATEVYTRVATSYWPTSTTETSAAEVDRLDDFDVTTVPNFEINNAFETATPQPSTTAATILTFAPPPSIITTTTLGVVETSTEDLDHIDTKHKISDTGETSIESNVIDPLHVGKTSTTTTTTTTEPTTTTTENTQDNIRMQSTGIEELDSSSTTSTSTTTTTTTTTPSYDDFTTTLQSISTKKEDIYAILPTIDTGFHVPKLVLDDETTTVSSELALAGLGAGAGAGGHPMDSSEPQETDVNVIIAISVSVVGIVALILLVAFLYVMRKRQKQMSYGQRCRPVSLDAYSLDNVSVYNSVRRKGAALRASKRSYGNVAFDDPSLRHNVLGTHDLAKFVDKKSAIWEEFKDVPQIIARADEVPAGCEDKNRYANVIPLPETRVVLQHQNGEEKTEYINANYVRGPKDSYNYYIACQAPLETTVIDFWRMIWEQNSRVIIMATDLIENGIDKCAEYLPPSVTLDNHTVFGDFQVTLKNREVKEKYAISTLILKNTTNEESREITHYWYQWPENGVPTDEAAIIAMLLEARSSLKLSTIEPSDNIGKTETIIIEEDLKAKIEINGNVTSEKPKLPTKDQGPLTIHCSPGTGRTGTIIACDIAMRCLEEPKRCVDIPQIVYSVRRGRASAVQTKEQYEFIYKVTHMYATKISNLHNDN